MTHLRYTTKRHVQGELVYVFSLRTDDRWMKLEEFPSRALLRGEIHELVLSANTGLQPSAKVRDVAYVGFFEVEVGGIAEFGDEVWAGEQRLGTLVGFDLTHYPNHLNIVVSVDVAATGAELELNVGTPMRFQTPQGAPLPGGRAGS